MSIRTIKTLCLFCGSSDGYSKSYKDGALNLAKTMIERNISLVYGGGGKGLMGTVSKAVYGKVPNVIGIIPEKLYESVRYLDHYEDDLVIVKDMHERKAEMYARSDAFVAMPGGVGTIEEFMEAYTWLHLGYHNKPIGLINIDGYFDHLLLFLNHCVDQGFLREEFFKALCVAPDSDRLLDMLEHVSLALPSKFH
ncbi:MAG: TIGR00730 family Rossman fold protein [Sphaerochaetaceae bacterium]